MLKKSFLFTFIFIVGLSFSGPFSLAQDPANPEIQEELDTKNLDKLLKDYNKDSEKVIKDAAVIKEMEATGELSDKEVGVGKVDDPKSRDDLTQERKTDSKVTDKKKLADKDLRKVKYSDALRVALAPLQKLDEVELYRMLKENTKDSSAHVYVQRFPRIMVLAVRLIKDPEALPALARIVDDQDKLIRFSGIMLFTILFGFALKRFFKKEGRTIPVAVTFWFIRFLVMTALRFGIIIYFYGAEVTPTINIAVKTLF